MKREAELERKIREVLKKVFGYEKFRENQKEIILNILKKRDVLAVMPTGFGKSLCFQIPAILGDGVTLVISPLISLMQDQVSVLRKKGVSAQQLNSSLTKGACGKILNDAINLKFKMLYVAPERLLTPSFLNAAKKFKIFMVVVDEAHCISKWGEDFRPSYVKMTKFFNLLQKRPIFACFTATATKSVRKDIVNLIGLNNYYSVITGFNRKNLFLDVIAVKESNKIFKLIKIMKKLKDENVIIYCATRLKVENIFEILKEKGYSVAKYHAGLKLIQRKRSQNYFLKGEKNILVATNAFGMGVDKKDIRFIIHFNMPMNLENYYQEVGRAGRDGKPSKCLMFYSDYDVRLSSFFIESAKNSSLSFKELEAIKQRNYNNLKEIIRYCETKVCFKRFILKYFDEDLKKDCNNCGNCKRKNKFKIFSKIKNSIKKINKRAIIILKKKLFKTN